MATSYFNGLDRATKLEVRLRVARDVTEEGISHTEAAERHRVAPASVNAWVKLYRRFGAAGLEMRMPGKPRLESKAPKPWQRANDRQGRLDCNGRWRPDDAYEPTPEEIEAGCLEIQASWSEGERARRWIGKDRLDWEAPMMVGVDDEGEVVAGWGS